MPDASGQSALLDRLCDCGHAQGEHSGKTRRGACMVVESKWGTRGIGQPCWCNRFKLEATDVR